MKPRVKDYKRVHIELCERINSGEVPATLDVKIIEYALQKQISRQIVKNPKNNTDRCPKCNYIACKSQYYCSKCGQKLDWKMIVH